MQWLHNKRLTLMQAWADGTFSAQFTMEMAVKNAGATGACSAYQDILNLEAEDLYGRNE